jgi:hypothetical protein
MIMDLHVSLKGGKFLEQLSNYQISMAVFHGVGLLWEKHDWILSVPIPTFLR